MNLPLVSINCPTFKHDDYIEDCIKGFLMQETNFEFEINICDDCSPDTTPEIVNKYVHDHPKGYRIKYWRHEQNIGMMKNGLFSLSKCTSKYTALCEGDDYWTDPHKLQKQVDFLEANPEYVLCFTGYKIRNEFTGQEAEHIPNPQSIDVEAMIKQNIYSTATAVFLSEYMNPIPEWFSKMVFGDWSLYINVLFTSKKKAWCLEDITSVYRIHPGGVHGNLHASNKKLIKAYKQHIDFYKAIQANLLKEKYSEIVDQCIVERKKIITSLLYKERDFVGVVLNKFF